MTNVNCDTIRERITENVWSVPESVEPPSGSRRISSVTTFRIGEQIIGTPWIVVRSLGLGGVGEVFEVEHALLGRRAAFKVLHHDNLFRLGLAQRMSQEGRLLAAIKHPNIVDVLDMGILHGGRPFLVLELLEGRDLRRESARVGVLSIPAALDIVTQVLRGLSALHEAAVVHRDIKLENLFLCADGHVEVIDLGAAERMGEKVDERAPSVGTPRTMAPEQCEGKPVDGRADLYALGIVLYELIAGRGPFDEVVGLEALRFAHCERIPPPPSRFAPQFVPPEIDALVLRALAKAPHDRFVSADAMALEIAALRADSSPADPAFATSDTEPSPSDTTVRSVCLPPLRPWAIRVGSGLRTQFAAAWGFAVIIWLLTIISLGLGVAAGRFSSSAWIVPEPLVVVEGSKLLHKLDPK